MALASYIVQGAQLFGRICSLSISNNTGVAAVWGNELPGQSPLRIKFGVEREALGPGKAKITLYNLNTASRNNIQTGTMFALRAGYRGSMQLLFSGKVLKVKTQREGPDITTECECSEGLNFTNYAVLHQSYAQGTQLYRVFSDLAQAMQIDVSGETTALFTSVASGIPNETLTRGLSVHGPVRNTLSTLCRARGLQWAIVNRQLRIRPKKHYDSRAIVVLNRESGLINVPGETAGTVTFECLLLPNVVPGSLVQLSCANQNLNGFYLVGKVQTEGDTHDAPWQHKVEGTPYRGSVNALPVANGPNFAAAVVP